MVFSHELQMRPALMHLTHAPRPLPYFPIPSQLTFPIKNHMPPSCSYPLLLAASLRVLVYNGDWDACVPYTDGDAWTSGMGFPVKRQWQVRMRSSCATDTALIRGRRSRGRLRAKCSIPPRFGAQRALQQSARDTRWLQVAGYSTEYDVSGVGRGSFEFITVRGVGFKFVSGFRV